MARPTFDELVQVYLGQGMNRSDAIQLARQQSGIMQSAISRRKDVSEVTEGTGKRPVQVVQQTPQISNVDVAPLSEVLSAGSVVEEAERQRVESQLDRAIESPRPVLVKKSPLSENQGLDFLQNKRVRQKDPLEDQLPTHRKFVVRPPKHMIEEDQDMFRRQGSTPRDRIQRPENLPTELHHPGDGGRPLSRGEEISPEILKSNRKVWMDNYGKTHTKDGKPLPHTFDPGDPGIGGGAFKRAGAWVDSKGQRLQAGTVRAPGKDTADTRTRDQLSRGEQLSEYDIVLDKQKDFFRKNYIKADGSFDWKKLDAASPKIRAAFAHLQHSEAVRQRIARGAPREELHAEGAREHLYQQAHSTGGVVMPDPDRLGQFIVADPRTGDKMKYNPAAQERIASARQKIANQRRIAENPLKYEQANLRGAKRRMTIEARKMHRLGRGHEAAMLELNIDDPAHPAVLLRAGAFQTSPTVAKTKAGVIRKGGGVDWEQYTAYAKDYNDRMQQQSDMTPAQAATYRMQTNASGWNAAMADLDKRKSDGTIGRVEYEDERARLVRQGEAAKAEVRGFNLKPAKAGTMDAQYRRGRDIFAGGSAFGSDIEGKDYWQNWLSLREKMFGDVDKGGGEGRTEVSEDLRRSGRGPGGGRIPDHPGAYGRAREDANINPGIMFRHGPEGGREFIDRDVYKHSITDEQREDMGDRYAHWRKQGQPGAAPAGPDGPAAPADPDAPAVDRFDWHDTTTSSSGYVMPQPPRGIVTADHLADTLVMSSGGVNPKGKGGGGQHRRKCFMGSC